MKIIKKMMTFVVLTITLCTLAGCKILIVEDNYSLKEIKGDIKCEYRVGKNAKWLDETVDTDVQFDKEMFVKLFNEQDLYDPIYLKNNPDKCDLKINSETQAEELQRILNSEVNIKALFEDTDRSVSIYTHNEKLYFFVLSMGGNSKPEEEGSYYMELSEEMDAYWRPIIEEIVK